MSHDIHDPTSPVADIGDADFDEATAGRWTAVDLWAPWCGPCRRFMPAFEQAAATMATDGGSVAFARVNVDDNPEVAARMAVKSIPTVILFNPEGVEVARTTGIPDADDLKALVALASS